MSVQVNFRWGHLDKMPRCPICRRIEGYCQHNPTCSPPTPTGQRHDILKEQDDGK